MLNNAKQLGSSNQNLILETAGRIYIKVADRFYELDFRDQNNKEQTTINNNIVQKEEADLSGLVTKKDLKSSLAQYMTKRD